MIPREENGEAGRLPPKDGPLHLGGGQPGPPASSLEIRCGRFDDQEPGRVGQKSLDFALEPFPFLADAHEQVGQGFAFDGDLVFEAGARVVRCG
jgi:hypothetical protein